MRGQRERGSESGELAQERRLPQCRDGEPRLGPPLGPGVPAEGPASPTSWEKSLGEGHRKQGRYNRDIHTQRDTSCLGGGAEPALPSLQHSGCGDPQSPRGWRRAAGWGCPEMGYCTPGSCGAGEQAEELSGTLAPLAPSPGLAVRHWPRAAPTLEPRSLKMISTSRIFPNCCKKSKQRGERPQSPSPHAHPQGAGTGVCVQLGQRLPWGPG